MATSETKIVVLCVDDREAWSEYLKFGDGLANKGATFYPGQRTIRYEGNQHEFVSLERLGAYRGRTVDKLEMTKRVTDMITTVDGWRIAVVGSTESARG